MLAESQNKRSLVDQFDSSPPKRCDIVTRERVREFLAKDARFASRLEDVVYFSVDKDKSISSAGSYPTLESILETIEGKILVVHGEYSRFKEMEHIVERAREAGADMACAVGPEPST
ncbi:MAG: hypothetical protein P4M11_11330 [Candidatus Pacebacteria bacterium]|nr:hypothetical protein [Candidatus Paceibacterota bacterium]